VNIKSKLNQKFKIKKSYYTVNIKFLKLYNPIDSGLHIWVKIKRQLTILFALHSCQYINRRVGIVFIHDINTIVKGINVAIYMYSAWPLTYAMGRAYVGTDFFVFFLRTFWIAFF